MTLARARFGLLLTSMALVCCQTPGLPAHEPQSHTITLVKGGEERTLTVEVADTPALQERGLMDRTTLPAGHGMLFVFGEEDLRTFWMKDTLIPLDILFFDAQGAFVSRARMVPCVSDPCDTYPSKRPAAYALEVGVGEAATEGVDEGWKMMWSH